MASLTKITWTKRDNRDAKIAARRQKQVKKIQQKSVSRRKAILGE
jgi:hypothetical protein